MNQMQTKDFLFVLASRCYSLKGNTLHLRKRLEQSWKVILLSKVH